MSDSVTMIPRLPVDAEQHRFHDWDIVYEKSHILHSMCPNDGRCVAGEPNCCELCFYEATLPNLPHLPEMVFPKNRLRLLHRPTGARLEFNALDALRAVRLPGSAGDKNGANGGGGAMPQVACAEEWMESRPHAQPNAADGSGGVSTGGQKVRPYDWTYSTDYQGTLSDGFRAEETEKRLNIAKLMQQERIEFYHDLSLFEDELHDHGIASCSVKIRVMPSGFFILLRYFLRIDGVMLRINDTRLHFEVGNAYILKEFSSKESKVDGLRHLPPSLLTRPSEVEKHLPVLQKTAEQLFFGDEAKTESAAAAVADA